MKLLLLKITAWACSVFFVLMGLTYLSYSIIGGLIIILAGLLINPILYKYFKKYAAKYKFNLKPWISSLIAIALIILGIVMVATTEGYKKNIANVNKAEDDKVAQKRIDDLAKADSDAKAKAEDEAKKKTEEDKKKAEELAKANRTPSQKVADLPNVVLNGKKGYISNLAGTTAILSLDIGQGNFLDSKDYLETMLKDFVKFGKEAFKIDKVDIIEVDYRAKLVDSFGKESEGNLLFISMTKENFLQYNFQNIQGKNFYNSVSQNAFIFILPSTKEKIDFSKVEVYL